MADGKVRPENKLPDVTPFQFYIDAFHELSTCRDTGFGVGPIPFTAIAEYARIFMVDDFFEFSYVIRRMDDKFLELKNRKMKNGGNK